MRIAIGIEYDGTPWRGWQAQPEGRTVQQAVEHAVGAIAAAPVRVVAAGRTDAGVHASLQVAHFDTPADRPLSAWVRGVNAHLPPSIAVLWARGVEPAFHARFSAQSRAYTYALLDRPSRPGLLAGRVGWFHQPLDDVAMREAADLLRGRHDFSAFRAAECQARSPVRTLLALTIERSADMLLFHFVADAFLHHSKGRHPPAWAAEVLASRDRSRAAPTFAPDGLYLTGVEYPAEVGLPESHRPVPLARQARA
jgi:tRNA pseudouridine38-40 synthase